MFSIVSCLVHEHDLIYVGLAISVLIFGSVIAMRLLARVRRTHDAIKILWLSLAGVVGGGTIWSTHFVSMLAYQSPLIVGYEPLLTAVSLVTAIIGTTAAFLLVSLTKRSLLIEAGGLLLGLSIATMHYIGMAAIAVSGHLDWDLKYVGASILVGGIFGVVTTSRVARPVTKYCKYGASLAFCFAVGSMHFTGMTALSIRPHGVEHVPSTLISGEYLGLSVLIVMALLLFSAFITYALDLKSAEQNSRHFKHLAMHDPLTSVLNRFGCESILCEIVDAHEDDTARIAVVAIDLDRFKEVNDVHGHGAGDFLLQSIADRLGTNFSAEETLARIGGDEFVAIKRNVFTQSQANAFCEKIRALVEEPVQFKMHSLTVSASIGYSIYPDDGATGQRLLERADLAMYRAKTNGRNLVCKFNLQVDGANREKSAMAMDLSKAVQRNELEIHYQLQNDARTREISGVEALVRWRHPKRGMVPPISFIPIAEEYGLITELGDWILKEACRQAALWPVPLKVAVNVATRQLADTNFKTKVEQALTVSGLDPSRLELEITESGIIADLNHALQIVRELKALGLRIAMDDYGTGYSSLATLQCFPFDKIKIDREFVKELHKRKQSAAIIKATIILAESLDIPVLAEGVESEDHLTFLRDVGCNEVQGYLFGRPMTEERLVELLQLQKNASELREAS